MSMQGDILEFLQRNIGLSFNTETIAKEVEVEKVNSVGTALSKLTKNPRFGVERVGRGMYRFNGPNHTRTGDMLEVIHEFESGKLLLKHENEQVYLATRMEG